MILDCNYSATNGLWFIIIHAFVLLSFPDASPKVGSGFNLHNTLAIYSGNHIFNVAAVFSCCSSFPPPLATYINIKWNRYFFFFGLLMKVVEWARSKNNRLIIIIYFHFKGRIIILTLRAFHTNSFAFGLLYLIREEIFFSRVFMNICDRPWDDFWCQITNLFLVRQFSYHFCSDRQRIAMLQKCEEHGKKKLSIE